MEAMKRLTMRGLLLGSMLALTLAACGGGSQPDPLFTNPVAKIAETADSTFTQGLLGEAVAYEPVLTQAGAQVHMGYWSGPGNHGSLVRVLDAINAQPAAAAQKAIWDEGVQSSLQYPAYVTMLHEHWYERTTVTDGQVTIYGVSYTDPFLVTFQEADDIWGQYSQRYAEMAIAFQQQTGNPVKAWCFVQGAKANRIFYVYELPKLRELEAAGVVRVFFAKTQDADWQNADDWTEGTENAPTPVPAAQVVFSIGSPRGISWDEF